MLDRLDEEIEDTKQNLNVLKEKRRKLSKIKNASSIKCHGYQIGKGCGKLIPIKKIELIQTYWYEEPWGCTGGDTWHSGETNFICPNCDVRNRPCWNPLFRDIDADFDAISGKFKGYKKEYDR